MFEKLGLGSIFPLQNDAVAFGLLMGVLGLVFKTSSSKSPFWQKFYSYIPSVLMCYLLPSFLGMSGIIDETMSGKLYSVAKNYLLPASLVLMTLNIDFKGLINLGPKALIMFFTATAGIITGGPIAVILIGTISPETFTADVVNQETWRGLTTLAGSWIGGSANQAAMLEIYEYDAKLYPGMVAVDILVANLLMAGLLIGARNTNKIDKWLKADTSSISTLTQRMIEYRASILKIPSMPDLMAILAVGFVSVGFAQFNADFISEWVTTNYPDLKKSIIASKFLWLVVIATTIGVVLSFTKARKLEGVGASRVGSVCIYILVATIGLKMDIATMFSKPWLIVIGIVWMLVHVGLLLLVAKLVKAPFFFVAVGSQANVGGAASAPIVAAEFNSALASVGAILAVLGYAVGTYGAIACAMMMELVSP